jgi:hypothetical protein
LKLLEIYYIYIFSYLLIFYYIIWKKLKRGKIINNYNYFSNINQDNRNALNANFYAISKLVKIMTDEGSSYEFTNSVIVLFEKILYHKK